jgi:hypothetical protein
MALSGAKITVDNGAPRVEASRRSIRQSSATAHPRIEDQACVDLR